MQSLSHKPISHSQLWVPRMLTQMAVGCWWFHFPFLSLIAQSYFFSAPNLVSVVWLQCCSVWEESIIMQPYQPRPCFGGYTCIFRCGWWGGWFSLPLSQLPEESAALLKILETLADFRQILILLRLFKNHKACTFIWQIFIECPPCQALGLGDRHSDDEGRVVPALRCLLARGRRTRY